MVIRVAELIVEIPNAGDLVPRCREYIAETEEKADIILRQEDFRLDFWKMPPQNSAIYLESGALFHVALLKFNGMMLHASAVEVDGKAYLFSADPGVGKSTHTRLWQDLYGRKVHIFNDDKPVLRYVDDAWFAYGTPWCGKDGININMKVPLAGICFLKQASENKIRRLNNEEAVQKIVWQTMHRFYKVDNLDLMLSHVDKLVRQIPIFELENRPEPAAAQLSYEAMSKAAEELAI